ncbi:MAG: poly-gamma-glutamate biosynthesis protein PgsC/CapC, partial [Planctomycetota bacterium]
MHISGTTPGITLASLFPLPIFPEGGLDNSIVTTVLVGLIIMVIFKEWFGWVLSGVVVPGYLAPIFIIQPWSGVVIVVEAILTHLLVDLFGNLIPRTRLWREFFGRDRFFAYLVFGTLVRMICEGFFFQWAGHYLNDTFGLALDYRNTLYSVGLIVVPLLANMFFKTGLLRGIMPIGTTIGLCFLVISYLLIPLTNFTIASFEIAYGSYAVDFLGNAKAYVVILTTAYLASRANLRYGWDYAGILVPALTALAWFTPLKVVSTVVEAILILWIARWITSFRILQDVTIEAGRKLLLTFGIGYALKLVSGYAVEFGELTLDPTDLYGFGYLLPSLIAGKMWQKDSIGVIMRPLLQTSLTGAVLGSLLTAGLFALTPTPPLPPGSGNPGEVIAIRDDLMGRMLSDKSRLVRLGDRKGPDRVYEAELLKMTRAVERLQTAQDLGPHDPRTEEHLRAAADDVRPLGYELLHIRKSDDDPGAYVLREVESSPGHLHGWGIYVFAARPDPARRLVVQVPRPISEWKTIECGVALFERLGARTLMIAGAHKDVSADRSADVLRSPRSVFHTIDAQHRHLAVLQVRGPKTSAPPAANRGPGAGQVNVHFHRKLPRDLSLRALTDLAGTVPRVLSPAQGRLEKRNRPRDAWPRDFASVVFDPRTARHTLSRYYRGEEIDEQQDVAGIDGYLLEWVRTTADAIAPSGSESFVAPKLGDLLLMDEEVLSPLMELRRMSEHAPIDPGALRQVAQAAHRVGYKLLRYTYELNGDQFLILTEDRTRAIPHHGGTIVLRLGASSPQIIEVPHPVSERYTIESGVRLFDQLEARALILAGASRFANRDGSADVSNPR